MLPKKAEYVRLRYDREKNAYYAVAFRQQEELSPLEYAILRAADGKTNLAQAFPELSKARLKGLIRVLRDGDLLVTSRMRGILIGSFTVFRVANRVKPMRGFCGIANLLLPLLTLLFVCLGAVYWDFSTYDGIRNLPFLCALVLLSVTLHEFGHFIAGVAYRYYVVDTGILLLLRVLPLGAYVTFAFDGQMRKRRHNVQFYLAGIEINLLLAGVFSLLAAARGPLTGEFQYCAILNVALAAVNLLPAPVLDGGGALGALFGIEHYGQFVKRALPDCKRLARSGAAGWLCLALALIGAVGMLVLIWLVAWDLRLFAEDIISFI